jgi:tRNA (guanine37-N1)-methyltransferase
MTTLNNLYVALIHFPVVNKRGKEIGSALTNMDLHDIARACKTFGIAGYYVVTPFEDQEKLAHQIIQHWTDGVGGELNPARKAALELIQVTKDFDQVIQDLKSKGYDKVVSVATSAKDSGDNITARDLKEKLKENAAHVLLFGTAWGLTQEFFESCDFKLGPIKGAGTYNHLSVRSAVSIYLDRIINS